MPLDPYGYGNTLPFKGTKGRSWILRLLDAWNEVKTYISQMVV